MLRSIRPSVSVSVCRLCSVEIAKFIDYGITAIQHWHGLHVTLLNHPQSLLSAQNDTDIGAQMEPASVNVID